MTSFLELNNGVISSKTVDITPTNGSTNPVESNGVFDALNALDFTSIDYPTYLKIGNPAHVDTLQEVFDHEFSSGIMDGCSITDNGNGTVSFSTGSAALRAVADPHTPIYMVEVQAQLNLALTDDATNYIYLDYNAGTPQLVASTSITSFNCLDKCIAYMIHRSGNSLNIVDAREQNVDGNRKSRQLFLRFSRFIHAEGGTTLGSTSTTSVSLTAGEFFFMLQSLPHDAFDTSVVGTNYKNVFNLWYRDGIGGWTSIADQKTVVTTTYDGNTGTPVSIGNNKYGVTWFYIVHDSPSKLHAVMGQAEYASQSEAESASIPSSVPSIIAGMGTLVGLVVYQKSAATFANTLSAFATQFALSSATSHNALPALQGGTLNEYYHFTNAQHTDLTDGGDSNLHYHATDRARANHTGTQLASTISDFTTASQTAVISQVITNGVTTKSPSEDAIYDALAIKQPLDAELTALASVTSASDALPYFTGSGTANTTTLTAFGRSLIDDIDASVARTTLDVAGLNVSNTFSASQRILSTLNVGQTATVLPNDILGIVGTHPGLQVTERGVTLRFKTNTTATAVTGFSSLSLSGSDGTYITNNVTHFDLGAYTPGVGQTVTNQYGFYVPSGLTTATNNYGFYSNIASGTGIWNFYANGTASNYFAGQTSIGTSAPNSSSKLQIDSTTQGFLPPRLTTTQRDAIATPATGLMIYNTTTNTVDYYAGGWKRTPRLDQANTWEANQNILGNISLRSDLQYNPQAVINANYDSNAAGYVNFQKARGTIASQTDVQNLDYLGTFNGAGYFNGGMRNAAFFFFQVDGTPSGTIVPGKVMFVTVSSAGTNNYFSFSSSGSFGVGITAPNASAKLQVESTTQGFLPPRMTTTQRDAISTPAAGLVIYNTTTSKHQGYNGTIWNDFY